MVFTSSQCLPQSEILEDSIDIVYKESAASTQIDTTNNKRSTRTPTGKNYKKKRLKDALTQLQHIRQNSEEHRKIFLANLKQRIATRQRTETYDPIKALEQVKKMEKQKYNYTQIRRVFNPSTCQPLVKVKIPMFTEHIHPHTGEIIYIDKTTNQQIHKKKIFNRGYEERIRKCNNPIKQETSETSTKYTVENNKSTTSKFKEQIQSRLNNPTAGNH